MFDRMDNGWRAVGWPRYLREQYIAIRRVAASIVPSGELLTTPMFAGSQGKTRAIDGHPPSEKVFERVHASLRATDDRRRRVDADDYLGRLEDKLAVGLRSPTGPFSVQGDLHSYPLPLDRPSQDFVDGPGRLVKGVRSCEAAADYQALRAGRGKGRPPNRCVPRRCVGC